jgi:hypothetical protein
MLKALATVTSAALALAFAQTAFAASDIYTGLGQGSDVSWPQCGNSLPTNASFGIVGIDHGRPFDVDNQYGPNTCLTTEYAWAPAATQALYMNTGYDPSYYTGHLVADCDSASKTKSSVVALQQAWEVGCATAWFNENYALDSSSTLVSSTQYGNRYGQNLAAPKMWWLDVETGNSWSSSDLTLNAETLQGAADELAVLTPSIPVGAYSTSYQWGQIAGSTHVGGLAATWVATGQKSSRNIKSYCSKTFDGTPAWLVQWVYHNTYDYDVAC